MTVGMPNQRLTLCGSASDVDACYYLSSFNYAYSSWDPLINSRSYPKSSTIQNAWLISGDGTDGDDPPFQTGFWAGTPTLPGPSR